MPQALAHQPFLRLDEVVLPTPWSAVVTIAMVAGLLGAGLAVARRLRREPTAVDVSAGFFTATALTGAIAQALVLGGVATPVALRVLGAVLVLAGTSLFAPGSRSWCGRRWKTVIDLGRRASAGERWLLAGSVLTVGALGLAALGPPTDIDTLAYHLSVPLDWLARGGAEPTPYWLHARLTGVGESLNLLGLSMGSDGFGAVLQATGLAAAAVAVGSLASTSANRILCFAVIAGCPVAVFLSLTAKPQLLPAAASATALALFIEHRRTIGHLSAHALWVVFLCASFAVACKYSFIPGGAAITALVTWSTWNTPWRRATLVAAAGAFVALALPVYVRNLAFYGDPISPMLEPLRQEPDAAVTAFRWYLRNFAGDHSLSRLLLLPWTLIVPTGPGHLTTVLGLGGLVALALPLPDRRDRDVLIAAAVLAGINLLGQLQARFFFESYLWFAVVAAATPWTIRKGLLAKALCLQLVVTLPVAAYGTVRLLPAALSAELRERALSELATDYQLSRWLDEMLPADAVIATDRHASLFTPRPATHDDYLRMLGFSPDAASVGERAADLVERSGASFLLVTEPVESSRFAALINNLGPPVFVSPLFRDAVRNPWREGPSYRVRIYRLMGR